MQELSKPYPAFSEMILSDIKFIQCLFYPELFKQGLRLFNAKWGQIDELCNFIENFNSNYVDNNSSWYEAIDLFAPSTNNCLERFNRTIKSRYTQMHSFDILGFIEKIAY